MPDERLDLDKLEARAKERLADYEGALMSVRPATILALLALAREAERWKALATKAAPAMAFCAGRTDHHATSVAAGIAWCNEFKDARNGIPQLAGEEEPSGE